MKKRAKVFLLVKIILAGVLIFFLVKSGNINKSQLNDLFNSRNIHLSFIAAILFLSAQMLATLRLRILLKEIKHPLRIKEGFHLVMIGNFFNLVIPGAIGGDIVKGYYLMKNEHIKKGKSAGILLFDRMMGLFSMFFLTIISVTYLLFKFAAKIQSYRMKIYALLFFCCFIIVFFIIFLAILQDDKIRVKCKDFLLSIFKRGILHFMLKGIGTIIKTPHIILKAFLISLGLQLMVFYGIYQLSLIISGPNLDFLSLTAVSSFVMLFSLIPVTPGNIGWTETVASVGWGILGLSAGAAIFLYWRIIMIICSLPWGLIYFMGVRKGVFVNEIPYIDE